MKKLLLMVAASSAMLITAPPMGADSCPGTATGRPAATQLVDISGKTLAADTQFLAERVLGEGRSMVYRQTTEDIGALIVALRQDGVRDGELLTMAYWQRQRCRRVQDRCEGECEQDGFVCQPQRTPGSQKKGPKKGPTRPNDPNPPDDGTDGTFRCVCVKGKA